MAIQSTSVLKKSVLFRAGELTDGTSPYDSKALEYINQIYRSVLAGGNEFEVELGQPWVWARAVQPGTIVLKPKYSTGTVTVTNGQFGAVLSTAPSDSMVGQWFKVVGRPEVFRITAHSSGGTGLTLDTRYTDDSGSGLPFEIYRIEYDLPGAIERLIGPMMVDRQQMLQAPSDGLINAVDTLNMAEAYPIKYIPEEIPQQFAQIQRTSSGGIRVKFNASVGSETRVSFEYIPKYNSLVTATVVTVAGNMFSLNSHGLKTGDEVVFDRTSGNINKDVSYYVINATENTFMVAYVPGGTNVPVASGVTYVVDSVPVIPEPFRLILDYGASFYLLTDKNDERADNYAALCKAKMNAMISANDRELSQSSGGRVGQIIPRLDMYSGPRRYWRQEPS